MSLVQELRPDVILLDINMPRLNGIQATAQIVADNPKARVIVLTMYRQDQYVFDAIKAGAKGYPLKNADAVDFIEGIRQVYRGEVLLDAHIAGHVVDEFRRLSRFKSKTSDPMTLTDNEMDILRLVVQGLSNEQIAQSLNFSPQTVANRIRLIYQQLHVNNCTQATLYTLRRGWADLDPEA